MGSDLLHISSEGSPQKIHQQNRNCRWLPSVIMFTLTICFPQAHFLINQLFRKAFLQWIPVDL